MNYLHCEKGSPVMKYDPAAVGSGGQSEAEGEQLSKSHSKGPSASLGKWNEEGINGGYHLKKLW